MPSSCWNDAAETWARQTEIGTRAYARLILLPVCAGIALGVFSAYADGIFAQYWQVAAPYPVRVAWLLAGVMGNGAGVWAIGALLVGYAAARTTRHSSAALVASVVFLLLAVASYYGTIVFAHMRPGATLAPTMIRWLLVAVVVGIISGTAGAWLVGASATWKKPLALALFIGYALVDCAILLRAGSGADAPIVSVVALYLVVVGLTGWVIVRSLWTLALAGAIATALAGGALLLLASR